MTQVSPCAPSVGTGQRRLWDCSFSILTTPGQGYKATHSARHRMNSDVTQESRKEHNDIVVGGYQQSRKDDSAF